MVTSMSLSNKHLQRLSLHNGRKFSFNMDVDPLMKGIGLEEIPMAETFVALAHKTKNVHFRSLERERSEEHLKNLVSKSLMGLRSGYSPTLCESGVGGTYFMHDEDNRTIGVFKPHDEEMWCMNNPKGFTPKTPSFKDHHVSRGAEAGEAAFREYAAYLLDHENFSGVPATGLVVCSHPTFSNGSPFNEHFKVGSFQEFKEHDFDAEDISSVKYQMFPVHEVHKIAILDIRLLNTDRHGGNILVKVNRSRSNSKDDVFSDYDSSDEDFPAGSRRASRDGESDMMFRMDMDIDEDYGDEHNTTPMSSPTSLEYELIPIDHGYTLPSTLSGLNDLWFEWLKWPQAKIPFGPEEQRYIDRLDADADVNILRRKFGDLIGIDCFKVLRITTTWLKIASRAGLTPYTIGYALCRKSPDAASTLEKICLEAQLLSDRQLADEGAAPSLSPAPTGTISKSASPSAVLIVHPTAINIRTANPTPPSPSPSLASASVSTPSSTPIPFLHLTPNASPHATPTPPSIPIPGDRNHSNDEDDDDSSSNEDASTDSTGEGSRPAPMSHAEEVFFSHLRAVMDRTALELRRSQSLPSRPPSRK